MDFSLLCAVHGATSRGLREMLESLKNQTNQSYELVFVVGAGRPKDQAMVQALLPAYPAARMVLRPNQETLAASATALLGSLAGSFVGFIGPRDCLQPTTLAAALNAFSEHPSAKVVFTDEECRDALNRITQRFDKLGLNPMRLRSQEYLRDLVLIDRNWLIQLGGFNPVTSEWPSHDIYLKTLELLGTSAFVHIPERLYQRFRVYRDRPADLRRRAHLPGFDTQAVRLHLQRQQIPATLVDHHRGTLQISAWMPAGDAPQVELLARGQAIDAAVADNAVTFRDGKASFTIADDHGNPLAGAAVTLDKQETRNTDRNGLVQFTTTRGAHTLDVYAPGFAPFTMQVVV